MDSNFKSQGLKPAINYTPAQNPFQSPAPSSDPFGDNDSGNTSGQDEFHLKRYNEGLGWDDNEVENSFTEVSRRPLDRSRSRSVRRRPRPGLAIITDFSKPIGRAFTDNLTVDRVKTQRPEVGPRVMLTARSQTVEHFGAEAPTQYQQASRFVKFNDIAGLHQQDKRQKTTPKSKSKLRGIFSIEKSRTGSDVHGDIGMYDDANAKAMPYSKAWETSPTNSSIVIGISVPENEVESHKPGPEANSALTLHTPFTPTIVVTPADANESWKYHNDMLDGTRRRRPASSMYSQVTHHGPPFITSTDTPPVPSMPNAFITSRRELEYEQARTSVDSWETAAGRRHRAYSDGTLFDEDEFEKRTRPRSSSAESKLAILPSAIDTARPRSEGWWNLMLSPMLSRAVTLISKKSPSTGRSQPPLPASSVKPEEPTHDNEKAAAATPTTTTDTTHKKGLNIARWSQWSNWERDREQAKGPINSNAALKEESEKGHKVQGSSATLHFVMSPSPVASGLAADYYHGCAVDSMAPAPYFECQNHSCAEGLPKLASSAASKGLEKPARVTGPPISQSPPNEMSHSPRAGTDAHLRSDSDSTIFDDEPLESFTPVSEETKIVPVTKPREMFDNNPVNRSALGKSNARVVEVDDVDEPSTARSGTPPQYSPPRRTRNLPKHITTIPTERQSAPVSPGPMSPEMQRAMAARGAIPMSEVQHPPPAPPTAMFVNNHTVYPELPSRPNIVPVSLRDIDPPAKLQEEIESRRQNLEKEDAGTRKIGGLWRGRGCIPKSGCFGRGGREGRNKRRWYFIIAAFLSTIIITSIVLATQLTRKGDNTPIQSQWLNLTGFPPMPTGISTVVQPSPIVEDTSCVSGLKTLWSCAVPKEDQASLAPNDPDQPNFRIEITFRNGTVNSNETGIIPTGTKLKRHVSRNGHLQPRQNDPFTNELFTPAPAAPQLAEQIFLGNTTDNITVPFDGEATPFFITFIPTTPILPSAFNDSAPNAASQLRSRQISNSSGGDAGNIPPPDIGSDGTAAPANLLPNDPLPYSQPVRFYNRGQSTEHYGFYTYFDKAIFMTNVTSDSSPDDQEGGCTKEQANFRCTFSQTRFLVRIWTNAAFGGTLDDGPTVLPENEEDGTISTTTATNSSATDFSPPGSFPYPVSITLDRHGGNIKTKGAYCYAMDDQGRILENDSSPILVFEVKGSGGLQINPAPSALQLPDEGDASGGAFDPNAGGIDGGTGGCSCEWRNWIGGGGDAGIE